jgi:hypothetical protein
MCDLQRRKLRRLPRRTPRFRSHLLQRSCCILHLASGITASALLEKSSRALGSFQPADAIYLKIVPTGDRFEAGFFSLAESVSSIIPRR